MGRLKRVGMAGLVAVMLLGATPAVAKDGDVIKQGGCSRNSDWKLKLSPEDGNIGVEYEVDTSKVGRTWKVALRHNGKVFLRTKKVTKSPSGSFEVRKVVNNASGTDKVRAHARNLKSGETCGGRASF